MFALHELSNKIFVLSSHSSSKKKSIANNLRKSSHEIATHKTIAFESDDNDYDVCVDYKADIIITSEHVRLLKRIQCLHIVYFTE